MAKYALKDMRGDFPDDDACLHWLRFRRWPEVIVCEGCGHKARYYRIKSRKVYGCEHCGHQISPTADTIFHKSSTALTIWFHAIYLIAQTHGGIPAKQIERETGVTYKTAWRMSGRIRIMLDEDFGPMEGSSNLPNPKSVAAAPEDFGGEARERSRL
jgi:transposase-like protein